MTDATYVLLSLIVFALGYIAGRVDLIVKSGRTVSETTQPPQSFFAKTGNVEKEIKKVKVAVPDIDTSLYVGAVVTDNLVKTNAATLGTTSTTSDNINASVSKLAQLKNK